MSRFAGPVSWEEARELVVGILLAVIALRVAAGIVRAVDADGLTGRTRFLVFTNNIGPFEGVVMVLAVILVCSAAAGTMPRFLRVWILRTSVVLAGLTTVGMVNVLTLRNAQGGAGKLFSVLQVGLPATALFVLSAWLAREVLPLPADDD